MERKEQAARELTDCEQLDCYAFPDHVQEEWYQNGMTKREYYAAQALQGLLSNPAIAQRIDFGKGEIGIVPPEILHSQISDLAVLMSVELERSLSDWENETD